MKESFPCVIVAAYNRPASFSRLLKTLSKASYKYAPPKIILSLDGGYTDEVLQVAVDFKRNFEDTEVEIIKRKKNIGLREHIIWCGDQSEKYGSVIVLEDDLVISPDFYLYATQSIEYYRENKNIAGISLYSQKYNEYVNLAFEPENDGRENYFMQIASSWGQAWTHSQWLEFKQWYAEGRNINLREILSLPEKVASWPESSWKKYFSAYLVMKNKYIVYPYQTYTSNCADPGGHHNKKGSAVLQVPISFHRQEKLHFNFSDFQNKSIKYDAFMERQGLCLSGDIHLNEEELEVDLHGSKPLELLLKKKYSLTSQAVNKKIKSFDFSFKPIEINILFPNDSGNIFLCKSKDVKKYSITYKAFNRYRLFKYLSYSAINDDFTSMLIAVGYLGKLKDRALNRVARKNSRLIYILKTLFKK